MSMNPKLPLYLALLLLTQCSKCKDDPKPADPAAGLPPATQTGANTFGCLINGQLYTPQGRVGLGENFVIMYDPTFNGGNLEVRTYSYGQSGNSPKRTLLIGGDSINHVGLYRLIPMGNQSAIFLDRGKTVPCNDYDSSTANTFVKGILNVTRLDLPMGIVSGTFDFTLAKSGCDTIRITAGRFDAKL